MGYLGFKARHRGVDLRFPSVMGLWGRDLTPGFRPCNFLSVSATRARETGAERQTAGVTNQAPA
ncbi:hypothetical protein Acsp05_72790 [Actinokineospora sp. NBRC 105648]|nr:hypothetical protein Acsp05_72790 [Actinokineospora sp. NBRC 105648]